MAEGDVVTFEVRESVAIVRLNRPEARNALSGEMLAEIARAYEEAEGRSDVRAMLLTGGPKVFASGADIRELEATQPMSFMTSRRRAAWERIAAFPKPAVAAVAGYTLGGGCELALSGDIVVAGDNAVFGQPEIRIGIIPGAGGTQRWARVAGRYRAADVVLTGRMVPVLEAWRYGLVNEIVPRQRVVEAGFDFAQRIAQFSPLASRNGKSAMMAAEEVGLRAGLDQERSLMAALLSTEDKTEGMQAFLEKRPPRFTGN